MLSTPKGKGGLFLASSLCDGLEDNNMRQVVTLLLNKDADPNVLIPIHGVTPFHLVIGNDSLEFAEEVTKLFLRHGGDPNVRSNDGMTPVHVAAAWGRINILQLLLANGGDPLRLDNDGRSPFHYAFDGKYFKAVTLLAKYCENVQEEDDKPKYNMVLDKVLVTNGDLVAEYVTSKNTVLNLVHNAQRNDAFFDFRDSKPNTSSMIANLNSTLDISDASKTECKVLNIVNTKRKDEVDVKSLDSPRDSNTITAQWSNLSQIDDKNMQNYSFVDLDFDFANLHLSDVMEKEKSLVSKIINHLSTTIGSDCINETLHNYKRDYREESSSAASNSDVSFQQKENIDVLPKHKTPKSRSSKPKDRRNKDILKFNTPNMRKQNLKHSTQSTSREKYREVSRRIPLTPTYILDNSIISMSPNFKTPNHWKRKSTIKTPLILSHTYDDSIVSKSPNFATPVCTSRKRVVSKESPLDAYFSSKIFKKSHENQNQVQYAEFNRHKKHIAQSTPRRRKRSIYKLRSSSSRKRYLDTYRQENDVIADEVTPRKMLKPVNLDKTIFTGATGDTTDTVDSSFETSPWKLKTVRIKRRNYYYKCHLALKLDGEKYGTTHKDGTAHDSNNSIRTCLDDSFNQMKKENESTNSIVNDKEHSDVRSENNLVNSPYVTVRKDMFKVEKPESMLSFFKDSFTSTNLRSMYTIESNSLHSDNFVDCVDCDTKKLLNEDLNVNISKICNLHARNWCSNRFREPSSHDKLAVENNSRIPVVNLFAQSRKQIYSPDSQRSCPSSSSRMDVDFERTESVSPIQERNLDMYKSEKSSSILSYVSTQQEYKYEDPEARVLLLERRLCVTSLNTFSSSEVNVKMASKSDASSASGSQGLPRELLFIDDTALRRELTELGDRPGPITSTTRRVYLKRLMHLRSTANIPPVVSKQSRIPRNYVEQNDRFRSHLEFGNWINHLDVYRSLEKHVFQEFASPNPSRRWREGTSKTSFTYLLLDPRVTQDLPNRSANLAESEVWSTFLNAIFYIGKGKRSRPFAHLYDASRVWVSRFSGTCKKIDCILDIWNNDHGVVCLHIFQNIIPVEAYTREAAMIDAMGTECLGNRKGGEYYGIAATWSMQQKQKFGRYLLYKALQILLHEGERQVFPQNL